MPDAVEMADKLFDWLILGTLPFWAERGVDREAGGFHERLDRNRQPVTHLGKRTMVQARQFYVFAQAGSLDPTSNAHQIALDGFDFLTRYCRHPAGGWRFSVHRDGAPRDDTRDLYAHAFVLFALAWRHRLDGAPVAAALAAETMAFLDDTMAHPAGGYCEALDEAVAPAAGTRRQNPHMHLLEAFLEWFEACGDRVWLRRADRIAALLNTAFVVDGTLREHFSDDLKPAHGQAGRLVEPGHHFEWVWLLQRFEALSGDRTFADMATALYSFAVERGIDSSTGGVVDAVDCDGRRIDANHRIWPQTEAIKAHLARRDATADPAVGAMIKRQVESLIRNHLDATPPGAWREHIAPDGSALVTGLPASSLYHLMAAAAALHRARSAAI